VFFLLAEDRISLFSDDDHITDEISKLFKKRYSTETVNNIKDFYFNKSNTGSEITKLENICNVSTVYW